MSEVELRMRTVDVVEVFTMAEMVITHKQVHVSLVRFMLLLRLSALSLGKEMPS